MGTQETDGRRHESSLGRVNPGADEQVLAADPEQKKVSVFPAPTSRGFLPESAAKSSCGGRLRVLNAKQDTAWILSELKGGGVSSMRMSRSSGHVHQILAWSRRTLVHQADSSLPTGRVYVSPRSLKTCFVLYMFLSTTSFVLYMFLSKNEFRFMVKTSFVLYMFSSKSSFVLW